MATVNELNNQINDLDYQIAILRLKKKALNEERKKAIVTETAVAKLSALKPEELAALGIKAVDQKVAVEPAKTSKATANFGK